MPKYLYNWYGLICNQPKMPDFPAEREFFSGLQLWVIDKIHTTKEPCKCGSQGCVYVEIRYKKDSSR